MTSCIGHYNICPIYYILWFIYYVLGLYFYPACLPKNTGYYTVRIWAIPLRFGFSRGFIPFLYRVWGWCSVLFSLSLTTLSQPPYLVQGYGHICSLDLYLLHLVSLYTTIYIYLILYIVASASSAPSPVTQTLYLVYTTILPYYISSTTISCISSYFDPLYLV